jgi:hypothetical protein
MTRKPMLVAVVTLVALLITATMAFAAVTFDPVTGVGFVGKGDVQSVYDWNNKDLQDKHLSVQFRVKSTVGTEVSWTCTKSSPQEIVQERSGTTTTSIQGLVSSTARERNQITGFILNGYYGDPNIGDPVTEGPAVGSCANPASGFEYDDNATSVPVSEGGLQVSIDDGENWFDLE